MSSWSAHSLAAQRGRLVVATLKPDDSSSLTIVDLTDGTQRPVRLPALGRVENLRTSVTGHLAAFSFTNSDSSEGTWRSLYVLDLRDPSGALREVRGLTGGPMPVSALSFVPGTARLVVSDRTTDSILDLATGTASAVDLRSNPRSTTSMAGQTLMLDTGRYAQIVSEFDRGTEKSVVTVTTGGSTTVLFRPEPGWARLGSLCISPDGRYLSVETISAAAVSDRYPNVPAFTPARTAVVDLTNGRTVGQLDGYFPSWCR